MVRRLARFFSRVPPRVSQIARGGLIGATPRGQPWTSAVTLPPGRNGLSAWRMAVLSTFREPSLCRHVHRALLRSVLLDVTPIIAATACHQSNDVERYSRFMPRAFCHVRCHCSLAINILLAKVWLLPSDPLLSAPKANHQRLWYTPKECETPARLIPHSLACLRPSLHPNRH